MRFPKDILIIILLTALSVICIFIFPFTKYSFTLIAYLLLGLLLPGYALVAVIFPRKGNIGTYRVILSIIISLIIMFVLFYLSRYIGFLMNNSNLYLTIGIFTILMSFIAIYRKYKLDKKLMEKEKVVKKSNINFADYIKEDLKSSKTEEKKIVEESNAGSKTSIEDTVHSIKKSSKPSFKETKEEEQPKITEKTKMKKINDNKTKVGFKSLDILLILLATVICVFFILTPNFNDSIIRTILIIFLILFLPGYSFVAVLYPKKKDLDGIQRIMLSFAFPLIGLAISIVISSIITVSINLNSILILISALTIILILIAFIRRRRVPEDEKFYLEFGRKKQSKVETIKEQKPIKEETIVPKAVKVETETTKKVPVISQKNPSFVTKDLFIIFLTTLLAIIFIITPILNDTVVRTILGLLLILFIPGYSLIAALFPKYGDLDSIERAALSFGLSIAVTPLIGLILNYTPWGIRLTPILISLSAFTMVMLLVAFIRRRRAPEGQKFFVDFSGFVSSFKGSFSGESKTSRILSIILILTIIIAISTTIYIIVKPKQGETFTEFYLLGPGGKASNYPTNLTVGETGSVIIGIVNHEYKTVDYQLVVTSNGVIMSEQNITLTSGNKTEIPYNFTASTAGNKKLEFMLYKLPDNTNIYRSLHLFVNVV
jgi:uncharacterized membrane protein